MKDDVDAATGPRTTTMMMKTMAVSERGRAENQQQQQQQQPYNDPEDEANRTPDDSVSDDQEADRILSDELLRLSFNERMKISEEIHGVRDAFPKLRETHESVELALLDMENAMDSMFPIDGLRSDDIPESRALRLAFLRCELFDAARAARRMLAYVSVVRSLSSSPEGFGGGGGRIRAKDWFTKEEYAALRTGVIQLLPFRDRSGRRVLVAWSSCFQLRVLTRVRYTAMLAGEICRAIRVRCTGSIARMSRRFIDSFIRSFIRSSIPLFVLSFVSFWIRSALQMKIVMYLVAAASEDIESQKKGMVMMIWPGVCDSITPSNAGILTNLMDRQTTLDVQASLPLRIVCVHFGYAKWLLLKLARRFILKMFQDKTRFNIITGV